jgi:hypothetical protein
MKFVQKMYSLFVWYIYSQNCAAIKKKKKSLWFQSIPCPNILISRAKELEAIAPPTFKN